MAGFTHARGPGKQAEGIPASNFSEGDVLVYDSNSSLSRAHVHGGSGAVSGFQDVAGIARADSTDSVNDLVPYTRPTDEDVFFSELSAPTVNATDSSVTKGVNLDILEDDDGRHYSARSGNTLQLVAEEGTADVLGQSDQSRVLTRFADSVLQNA